ncbi:MAG TPA: cupin domain-containing protein [Burkholderiaceae bacterium]|jgi:50S ribosomal protein L16 3-hydroxylase|nr:cupin domain-containing protein [Burkholderiaceae bacterium]
MSDAANTPSGAPVRALTHLGALRVREFLARHWQRRPLLIRQALPDFASPFAADTLFDLSALDEVESRLVQRAGGRWKLRHGPFRRGSLPSRRRPGWTLLVQGVDLHLQAAADLLARFRFVPDARLDDLMVSYASDGGGVGPHIDSYDVLLLQAFGRRRWRIQQGADPACVAGLPIRQLARFAPQDEWELQPGDVLYLPPGVAHDGVAVGECITCSIGFRVPAWPDLADLWSQLQSGSDTARRAAFHDAGLAPSPHPARLPAVMVDQAHRQLLQRRPGRQQVALALLRQLSEPKARVSFEAPRQPITRGRFAHLIRRYGLRTDRRTRMLYSGATLAINGELVPLTDRAQRTLLQSLADRRVLPAQGATPLAGSVSAQLYEWYLAGWLHLIVGATSMGAHELRGHRGL